MKLDTVGSNIRKIRIAKGLTQEALAEKTELSANYIGMIERGEKTPSLESFVDIANALSASADVILADVINTNYTVKSSLLGDKLAELSADERRKIYEIVDLLIKQSTR